MSATELVRCPACRSTRHADTADTTFDCVACSREWRWAVCRACDHVELALAGSDSWRCSGCARYTRAWWRTDSAEEEAGRVRRRRQAGRDAIIEARLAAPRRKRRLFVTVAMAAGTLVALLAGGVVAFESGSSAEDQTRVACIRFGELRSDITNGAVDAQEVAIELGVIRRLAANGHPAIASAARGLVSPSQRDSPSFLVAQSRFANACETASVT